MDQGPTRLVAVLAIIAVVAAGFGVYGLTRPPQVSTSYVTRLSTQYVTVDEQGSQNSTQYYLLSCQQTVVYGNAIVYSSSNGTSMTIVPTYTATDTFTSNTTASGVSGSTVAGGQESSTCTYLGKAYPVTCSVAATEVWAIETVVGTTTKLTSSVDYFHTEFTNQTTVSATPGYTVSYTWGPTTTGVFVNGTGYCVYLAP
jgi:hypothetical protein